MVKLPESLEPIAVAIKPKDIGATTIIGDVGRGSIVTSSMYTE